MEHRLACTIASAVPTTLSLALACLDAGTPFGLGSTGFTDRHQARLWKSVAAESLRMLALALRSAAAAVRHGRVSSGP
jgi:hypothetical protein